MILLLIRHGLTDAVGRSIAGRAPGVHLNAEGAAQAERLGSALAPLALAAVYSSPLERAVETARPIAAAADLTIRLAPGLTELDFGEWTGRTLDQLAADPRWRAWNEHRGSARMAGGETMAEAIDRAEAAVAEIQGTHDGRTVAAVTHGDVIRGLVTRWLGLPPEAVFRLEADPASVTAVALSAGNPRLLTLNWRAGQPV